MWIVGTAVLCLCVVDYRVIFFILDFDLCIHLINMVAELGHWELSSVSLAWGLCLELRIFDFLTEVRKSVFWSKTIALFLGTRNVFGGFVVYRVLLTVYIAVTWKELWVYVYKTSWISCSKDFYSFIVLVSSIYTLRRLLFQLKFYPFTNSPCFSISIAFVKLAYRSSFILISWFKLLNSIE